MHNKICKSETLIQKKSMTVIVSSVGRVKSQPEIERKDRYIEIYEIVNLLDLIQDKLSQADSRKLSPNERKFNITISIALCNFGCNILILKLT